MSETVIFDLGRERRLNVYLIEGEFDNEILMRGKEGVTEYSARSFREAERIAKSIGLKRLKFGMRTPLTNENPEPCKVIDINTRQYIN
ncbi:hypothetical protein HYT25_02790 [Candidatus Pacearchaeota archaeon]|nr:hypothetical protein [Candidatus Pacearchaeota archaeon]